VTEGNERGLPFYRARGFQFVERKRAYAARPEEDLWELRMRKSLQPDRSRPAALS
jgi:hypothetical protein